MSSEFELIRRYFTRPTQRAVLGVGDDCALIRTSPGMEIALSTDMLVEGRHFVAGTDAERLGRKCLAVNLSDLAACAAEPAYALLALALPDFDEPWVEAFSRGLFSMAERFGVDLVGGDTTRGPRTICITVAGEVPAGQALRRSGAFVGDDIWISGPTGEAALGLAHMQGELVLPPDAAAACLERLENPEPRVSLGLRLRGLASSAIDVSDGLLADLGHIAKASSVAMDVSLEHLPRAEALKNCGDETLALRCIAGGGDDYEIAFTAPAERRDEVFEIARALGLQAARIGAVRRGSGVSLRDAAGNEIHLERRGFDHFA